MTWLLLLLVPVAAGVEALVPDRHLLVFGTSSVAILPLAAWMGWATEKLADRLGEGVGGLLNATFGNAAELIIAIVAMRAGLNGVVEASIAGSIIGNILLVLGASMLAGGLLHSEQHFNPVAARSQATMLTLAAIALVVPAAFEDATAGMTPTRLDYLSASVSVVLLVAYAYSLFSRF
jgi:Ca2+:H+ antiporter